MRYSFVFQVNGKAVALKHPMSLERERRNTSTGLHWVNLLIQPVAALWELRDNMTLRNLCRDVLLTLNEAHQLGFVHRWRGLALGNLVGLNKVYLKQTRKYSLHNRAYGFLFHHSNEVSKLS